jgi:hypothetical protein
MDGLSAEASTLCDSKVKGAAYGRPLSTQWSAPTLEAQALRDEFRAEPDRTHPRLLRRVELF